MKRFIDTYFPGPADIGNFSKEERTDIRKQYINSVLPVKINNPNNGTYVLEKYLVSGTYGDVFQAINSKGAEVALKITLAQDEDIKEALAYSLLTPTCGAYILCLLDAFKYTLEGDTWLIQVQPLMDGDLLEIVPDYDDIGYLLVILLFAADCLHQQGIAHMDIKPENVFYKNISDTLAYKLGDLGLSCAAQVRKASVGGLVGEINLCKFSGTYIPPDMIRDGLDVGKYITFTQAKKIDLWGIGTTIYLLLAQLNYYPLSMIEKFYSSEIINVANGSFWTNPNSFKQGETVNSKFFTPVLQNTQKYLNQDTIEDALGQLLLLYNKQTPSARDILRQIVRQQGWAKLGEEDAYIEQSKAKFQNDCALPSK